MNSPAKKRGRPFLPGNRAAANRPPSVAAQIAAGTRNGADIVDMFRRYASGEERCSARDRIEAGKWLADRLWGRAVETSVQVMAAQDRATVGALALSTAALVELYARLSAAPVVVPGEPRIGETVVDTVAYAVGAATPATSPPFSETPALVAGDVPPTHTPTPKTGATGPRKRRPGAPSK